MKEDRWLEAGQQEAFNLARPRFMASVYTARIGSGSLVPDLCARVFLRFMKTSLKADTFQLSPVFVYYWGLLARICPFMKWYCYDSCPFMRRLVGVGESA